MTLIAQCASLTEVRQNIDRLDRQLVVLITQRAANTWPATLHPPSPPEN